MDAVALPLLHTPTSTRMRSPVLTLAVGWRARLAVTARFATCWTNARPAVLAAAGVTAFDAAESALEPTAFVALTLKVYAVPLVRPPTVALVGAGAPVTSVGVSAVEPA